MSERPILFNGDMVRAILSGEKTQTRRMVKYIPAVGEPDAWCNKKDDPETVRIISDYRRFCPFGEVGDRMWVRETWWHYKNEELEQAAFNGLTITRLDGKRNYFNENSAFCPSKYRNSWRCRPSIHMPRWASRITLEIVGVRVERLNSISEEDAKAEGTHAPIQFALLWDSIYKNWDENPWVWVVEFKRVEVM